jgi:hypothetical protein
MIEGIKVVAQKADPNAVITKSRDGRGFETTVINVLENGTERPYRVSTTRKKDLVKRLTKLPVENVVGMSVDEERGFVSFELFAYNGV